MITDDDILDTAEQLAKSLDLDDDDRNEIVLRIQRLIWPPSPHPWMHESPGFSGQRPEIEISEDGHSGTLSCHGCGRRWRVNQAPGRSAVWDALDQAHDEYRSGRIRSEAAVPADAPLGRRLNLATLTGRAVSIEVTDERWTG